MTRISCNEMFKKKKREREREGGREGGREREREREREEVSIYCFRRRE